MDFLARLLDTSDFPARWHCGHWTSAHGWLHILSDLGVWSAYFAIPIVMGYFIHRRRDLPFRKVFLLFVAFIMLCGMTHLMDAAIFWWPAYRLSGTIKLLTAVVSWVTVVALVRVSPSVLAMRTPSELEREIGARKVAEGQLQVANTELEKRVEERTTELSQSVAALQRERELLRTTLASIADAVITTDNDVVVTGMNVAAESLIGWTNHEASGHSLEVVFRTVDEATRQPVENLALRALTEGGIVGFTNHTLLIAKDGSERPIDAIAAPIRSNQVSTFGSVLVFRDVTGRRQSERQDAERLQAARLLSAIVESSDDAIISKSLEGIIQSWNASAERLFGYTAAQAIGQHISLVIPTERLGEEVGILARIKDGNLFEHFDTVRRHQSGKLIQVALSISPIRDEEGRIVGASKIVRDITQRKHVEEELRRLSSELSEANRRKDEFLATLAHELRNPLAPIRNGLAIIRHSNSGGGSLDQVCVMMERQLGQMVHLIDDLLDVSRISQGKLKLRKERVELAAVLNDAVETSRPLIESCGHELTVVIPHESVYVNADVTRLGQVFSNLLNNAAKYSERGGHIWLTANQMDSHVIVSVKDTGVGIPPAMLPRIFEMFTQVDQSLEKSQGGLGIGLCLVKQLVEMHNGIVEAHSEGHGKGSEFIVRLPLELPNSQRTTPPTDENQSARSSHRFRILVADDNKDAASTLALMIKIIGNEVCTANDGLQAVEQAEAFRPEVIFLDIGMPKLNGYEACRRIRQQPWGKKIVLIALTGWGQEDDKRRSEEAGFNHHMVKPVDPAALKKLLAELQAAKV